MTLMINKWLWPLMVLFAATACENLNAQQPPGGENATNLQGLAEPRHKSNDQHEDDEDDEDDDDDDDEDEQPIALENVPGNVKNAALAALPGFQIRKAKVEEDNGQVVYELDGVSAGVEYEIEVDRAGKVLEVERKSGDD